MSDDKIEISLEDLDDDAEMGRPAAGLPHLSEQPAPTASGLNRLGANSLVAGLVAGMLGGALGALIVEALSETFIPDDTSIHVAVLAGVVGLFLGFFLAAWPDLSSGATAAGLRRGAQGAALGLLAGLVALGIGDAVYDALGSQSDSEQGRRFALWVAWILIGGLVGGGLGVGAGTQRILNGLIGGAAGGLVGGLVYVGLAGAERSEFVPELIAVTITTAGIGVGIGAVERARRQGWLTVVAGPLSGKEFILYQDRTSIGSAASADIVLAKDRDVHPVHAIVDRTGDRSTITAEGRATLEMNGHTYTQTALRPNDLVNLGRTTLRYSER